MTDPDPASGNAIDGFTWKQAERHFAVICIDAAPTARPEGLTEAEWTVARLIVAGLDNREIATARGASPRTIANQLQAIFRKLRVHSRHELCAVLGEPSK